MSKKSISESRVLFLPFYSNANEIIVQMNRPKSLIQIRPYYTMQCMKQTSEILITDTDYLVLFLPGRVA